jgi:hypothetical protein
MDRNASGRIAASRLSPRHREMPGEATGRNGWLERRSEIEGNLDRINRAESVYELSQSALWDEGLPEVSRARHGAYQIAS